MKKLFALLIATSFLVMAAGTAFADEPMKGALDRHAVWTKWFDEKGNRIPENMGTLGYERGTAQKASAKTTVKGGMSQKVKKFDFINETKSYDYSKDRGHAG